MVALKAEYPRCVVMLGEEADKAERGVGRVGRLVGSGANRIPLTL